MGKLRARFNGRTLAAICAGVLAGGMLVGVASALTAPGFTYTHPHVGYVSVARMDMIPDGNSAASNYFDNWVGVISSNSGCFNAGVNLPNGAHIKSIQFTYNSGPAQNFDGYLYREPTGHSGGNQIAAVHPTDDSGLPKNATANVGPVVGHVSNGKYAYGIGVCANGDTGFYNAKITYTYTSAGD